MTNYGKKLNLLLCTFLYIALFWISPCEGTPRKYALLIGIEDYSGDEFEPLRGSLNDVRLVSDTLMQERFGFESKDITILLNSQASHSKILGAFDLLSQKIQRDDIVYIHYSGHGSRALDQNGDEKNESGYDSTLVSYGARTGNFKRENALDDYDILDDELELALFKMAEKTSNIVFISDSCHSGTITRGSKGMATRGIAMDSRAHPVGTTPPLPPESKRGWLAVGAALDREEAKEYNGDDGKVYGAFTWFWIKALQMSASNETWQTVYERTRALMRAASCAQTPLLEGNVRMEVFGEEIDHSMNFTVTAEISQNEVVLNAGLLSGISRGSEFHILNPDKNAANTNTVLIVQNVEAASCTARVSGGSVKAGARVILTKWRPAFSKIKITIQSDVASDAPLVAMLSELFKDGNLSVYELCSTLEESRLLLRVVRPKTDENGEIVMQKDSNLPESVETAAPQVWVMTSNLSALHGTQENLRIPLDNDGLDTLQVNLERIARIYALQNMQYPGDYNKNLIIKYKLFVPATNEEWNILPANEKKELSQLPQDKWKLSRIEPANSIDIWRDKEERVISIQVKNETRQSYHIYAVNLTGDAINPFLPPDVYSRSTEVLPGQTRDFDDISVLLLTEAQEYIRVIATANPINIHVLSQPLLTKRSADNPIEAMLHETIYRTRDKEPSLDFAPSDLVSKANFFISK